MGRYCTVGRGARRGIWRRGFAGILDCGTNAARLSATTLVDVSHQLAVLHPTLMVYGCVSRRFRMRFKLGVLMTVVAMAALAACGGTNNTRDAAAGNETGTAGDGALDTTQPATDAATDAAVDVACTATQVRCPNGACANVATDSNNCGGCGIMCRTGTSCQSGQCLAIMCSGATPDVCGNTCVNRLTDVNNCGTCGRVCPTGSTCTNGACICSDPSTVACTQTNMCANLATSTTNCGACGRNCGTGGTCVSGVCMCAPGAVMCNGSCALLATDLNNCGTCGNRCATNGSCVSGVCNCPAGEIKCGTLCVSLATDVNNCGGCGNNCGTGQTCVSGQCNCTAPLTTCGTNPTRCADLQTSNRDCGTCGNRCQGGQTCAAGTCSCPQGSVWDAANSRCVVLSSDPNNCGAIGATCNNQQWCTSGQCQCRPGFAGANCTISLNSDSQNCGSLGNVCAGASPRCVDGVCRAVCPGGPYDPGCAAGQCVNTDTNPMHCGGCGTQCAQNEVCVQGTCQRFYLSPSCNTCPCTTCANNGDPCCANPTGGYGLCVTGTNNCPVY